MTECHIALLLYAVSVAVVLAICFSTAQQGIAMMVSNFRVRINSNIHAARALTPADCVSILLPIVGQIVGYLVLFAGPLRCSRRDLYKTIKVDHRNSK